MKKILIFCYFLFTGYLCNAQHNYAGEYGLDTSFVLAEHGNSYTADEYFQANAKYPESSMALLKMVRQKAEENKILFRQNGFISFRFTVNSLGQASYYRLYLLDENYKDQQYDKEAIAFFYDFVKGLKNWKVKPALQHGGVSFNYNTYLSFQIKDGKILSVAP